MKRKHSDCIAILCDQRAREAATASNLSEYTIGVFDTVP